MTLGRKLRDAVEDQGDRRRFTGTGRSQHGEMLRQHRIDVERSADVLGRINGADLDVRLVARGEYRAKVVGGDRKHFAAGDRVAGDAAAEATELTFGVLAAFAEEVDLGHHMAVIARV